MRLDGEGVAHHADVRAHAAELDGRDGFGGVPLDEPSGQVERTERGLFEYGRLAGDADRLESGDELPSVGACDAVRDGEVAALLRGGVIVPVRILGEHDGAVEIGGISRHGVDDGPGLGCSEHSIDKIVLHVDDDQIGVGHGGLPGMKLRAS